jgi:formamidopyrimidine-DNA glycosylase
MPELPEVETIRRRLVYGDRSIPSIIGAKILKAEILWEGSLAEPNAFEFLKKISNTDIQDIHRRGKYFIFELSEQYLVMHLRMSGDLLLTPDLRAISKYTRIVFNLDNGYHLVFIDARKFGRVWLSSELEKILGSLGPEPLSNDYTSEIFFTDLHRYHRQIKPLLLDQSFIAGLGNIYTDEALFQAKIHPLTKSNEISRSQANQLFISIRSVLQKGIALNGASIDWVYRGGNFQNSFMVYHRKGKKCYNCGDEIKRIVVGQRGTHYCPTCQPIK